MLLQQQASPSMESPSNYAAAPAANNSSASGDMNHVSPLLWSFAPGESPPQGRLPRPPAVRPAAPPPFVNLRSSCLCPVLPLVPPPASSLLLQCKKYK